MRACVCRCLCVWTFMNVCEGVRVKCVVWCVLHWYYTVYNNVIMYHSGHILRWVGHFFNNLCEGLLQQTLQRDCASILLCAQGTGVTLTFLFRNKKWNWKTSAAQTHTTKKVLITSLSAISLETSAGSVCIMTSLWMSQHVPVCVLAQSCYTVITCRPTRGTFTTRPFNTWTNSETEYIWSDTCILKVLDMQIITCPASIMLY